MAMKLKKCDFSFLVLQTPTKTVNPIYSDRHAMKAPKVTPQMCFVCLVRRQCDVLHRPSVHKEYLSIVIDRYKYLPLIAVICQEVHCLINRLQNRFILITLHGVSSNRIRASISFSFFAFAEINFLFLFFIFYILIELIVI